MSLTTTGVISDTFRDKKTSSLIGTYNCQSNVLFNIPRNSDVFMFHSFIFESNPKDIISLDIEIGSQTIWSIDFDLLMNLWTYNQKYKTLYMPKDFLIKDLFPFMALYLHNITINLKSKDKINYTVRIIEQFISNEMRNKLSSSQLSYKITQYPCIIINKREELNIMKSVKGFYIIGPKINSVKLLINCFELFNYSHREIKEFGSCKKAFTYNTKLLYRHGLLKTLPVEIIKHIETFIKKDYIYNIPIGLYNDEYLEIRRIDSVVLEFNDNYERKIIGLDRNLLKVWNGLGCLVFI